MDAAPIAFDVAPTVEDGVALIPVRQVLEHFGAYLLWDNQTKTATLQVGGRTAVRRVRENEAQLDGAPLPLDARLRIVRGRSAVHRRCEGRLGECGRNAWLRGQLRRRFGCA